MAKKSTKGAKKAKKPPRPKKKPAAKKPATKRLTASERIDADLATCALIKRRSRKQPTAAEREALKRWERRWKEDLAWEIYRAIPQKHWRQMSGRQTKVLHEQADRYGIPFGGAKIDLPAVVKALHDFLAKHGRRILIEDEDGALLAGGESPALERVRSATADLREIERDEKYRSVVAVDHVRKMHERGANLLRAIGEKLLARYGNEAVEILDEGLDAYEELIERHFGEDDQDGDDTDSDDPDGDT